MNLSQCILLGLLCVPPAIIAGLLGWHFTMPWWGYALIFIGATVAEVALLFWAIDKWSLINFQ